MRDIDDISSASQARQVAPIYKNMDHNPLFPSPPPHSSSHSSSSSSSPSASSPFPPPPPFSFSVSLPSSSMAQLGGRTLDRHNPIIADSRRFTPASTPLHPPAAQMIKKGTPERGGHKNAKVHKKRNKNKEKVIFSPFSLSPSSGAAHCSASSLKREDDCTVAPPESSRYLLLEDSIWFDGLPDDEPVMKPEDSTVKTSPPLGTGEEKLVINASKYSVASSFLEKKQPDLIDEIPKLDEPVWATKEDPGLEQRVEAQASACKEDKSARISEDRSFTSSPSSDKKPSSDQVVVLRVSLHCKGCAGKVKKHLSKMEGVTSFNIDFAEKKVTVTGDVTPLGVLASISKVKTAQFWPEANQ